MTTEVSRYFDVRRLGHVNLYVSDLERSSAFYRDVAGIAEAYVQPQNKAAFFSNNNTHHDVGIIDCQGPISHTDRPGLNHLGFEIETEVDLVKGYERAIRDGVSFAMTQDHDIAHSVYVEDAEGIMSEVYADVIYDWRAARSGVVTKPKPKWAPGTTPPNPNRNYHVNPELLRVDGAVFQPKRVVHAALAVSDVAASTKFFETVVGLQKFAGGEDQQFAVLGGTCGEWNLTLLAAGEGRAPGLHHFGLELWTEAELEESVDRARSQGITLDRTFDTELRRGVVLKDPDGFSCHFYVNRDADLKRLRNMDVNEAALVL